MQLGMYRQVRIRLLLVPVAMVQMVKESHQIPRWQARKRMVDSIGERNALGELSAWRHETKCFPWPCVELERDSIEIVLAVNG